MGLSDPWAESLDIISLQPVKKWIGVNPMGLSAPRINSLVIVFCRQFKKLQRD